LFMKVLLFIALVVLASALTETEYRESFADFKLRFNKVYLESEENTRYNIFKENLDRVNAWDAEDRGFTIGINEFADLSSEEFVSLYNGFKSDKVFDPIVEEPNHISSGVGADIVNWVDKGAVTPIKNQGQCGSCWSFSATGSMEGAKFLKTGTLTSLSEQNLVDCSTKQGNDGCQGGLMDRAFQYVIDNHGIDTEASYPYTATGPDSCKFKAGDIGDTISSYTDITAGSETSLQTAANQQPISVGIDASNYSFQLYTGGVYYEPECSTTQLDHGVLVVGYGTSATGTNYWLVKNSWGTNWGMKGFIQMSKDRSNNCGIATSASYPVQ